MERMQITLVLNLISVSICVLGDAVAVFPHEARSANQFQYITPFQQFQPMYRNAIPQGLFMIDEPVLPQGSMEHDELVQPILHTGAVNPPPVPERPLDGPNFAVLKKSRLAEEDQFRAAKGSYDYPAHGSGSFPSAPSYGYSPPATPSNYSPPASPSSYSPPAAPAAPSYAPAPAHHPALNKFSFKPDLSSLIKPVTTKAAGKVSGLISLVLSLLSGSGENLEFKGFKEILINGIVKPLLVAKGGLKSLISKLTIPLISLLLINLEVLITVWWLWEECPESKPTYEYAKPPSNSYAPNSYTPNSYR